jgi:hypothetical protein
LTSIAYTCSEKSLNKKQKEEKIPLLPVSDDKKITGGLIPSGNKKYCVY